MRVACAAVSPARAALGNLQVKTDALSVDQHRSPINQLLPGTVVTLVAAQRGEGEKEFHGLGIGAGAGLSGEVQRAAESQAVKLRIVSEVAEYGADQMGHVVIEGQRGQ